MTTLRFFSERHLPTVLGLGLSVWKLWLLAQLGPISAGDSIGYRLYADALLGLSEPYFVWDQYGLQVNVFEQRPPLMGALLAISARIFGSSDLFAFCAFQILVSCLAYVYIASAAANLGCGREAPIVLFLIAAVSFASFPDYAVLADSLFASAFLIAMAAVISMTGGARPRFHLFAFFGAGCVLVTAKSFGTVVLPLVALSACALVALRMTWRRSAAVAAVAIAALAVSGAVNARFSPGAGSFSFKSGDHVFHYANALFVLQAKGVYSFDEAPELRAYADQAIEHSERVFRRGVYLISRMTGEGGKSLAEVEAALRRSLVSAALARPVGFIRVTVEELSVELLSAFASVNRALMPMMSADTAAEPGPIRGLAILYDGWFAWIVSYIFIGGFLASMVADLAALHRNLNACVSRLLVGAVAVVAWIPVAIINFELRLIAFTIPLVGILAARWLFSRSRAMSDSAL